MNIVWNERKGGTLPVDVVAASIDAIVQRDGVCNPRALVDEARPEDAVLHPLFEWDDSIAAESWRREQARYTIRAILLVTDEGRPSVNAYVHVTNDTGGDGYIGAVYAMSNAAMSEQVLADALKLLIGLQRRYSGLKELAPVWEALKEVKVATQRKKTAV